MKTSYIIIALVLLVIAYFVMNPRLLGAGGGLGGLSLIPTNTATMGGVAWDSGLNCTSTQDCINYALAAGETQSYDARCETTCIYTVQTLKIGDKR